MSGPQHPSWCDTPTCTVAGDVGEHRSAVAVVSTGRPDGPVIRLLLVAPRLGRGIRIRMVIDSRLLIMSVDVDLDTAHLLIAHVEALLARAKPIE